MVVWAARCEREVQPISPGLLVQDAERASDFRGLFRRDRFTRFIAVLCGYPGDFRGRHPGSGPRVDRQRHEEGAMVLLVEVENRTWGTVLSHRADDLRDSGARSPEPSAHMLFDAR